MTKNLKLPKSISSIMEDLGFSPKAPKSTQVAFLKYIAKQMRIKKYGYTNQDLNKKPKTNTEKKDNKIINIKHAYKQGSLFDDLNIKKKTS